MVMNYIDEVIKHMIELGFYPKVKTNYRKGNYIVEEDTFEDYVNVEFVELGKENNYPLTLNILFQKDTGYPELYEIYSNVEASEIYIIADIKKHIAYCEDTIAYLNSVVERISSVINAYGLKEYKGE